MEFLILFIPSIISVFIYYHFDDSKKSIVYFFYYGIFCLINNLVFIFFLLAMRGNEFILNLSELYIMTYIKYFAFALAIAILPTYLFVIFKKKTKLKVELKDEEK